MLKKTNSMLLLIGIFTLTSCGSLSDAGKTLRNQKNNTTDEFLIKKRDALIQPPDFEKIPAPDTIKERSKKSFEDILNFPKDTSKIQKSKSSSAEESILNRIKK